MVPETRQGSGYSSKTHEMVDKTLLKHDRQTLTAYTMCNTGTKLNHSPGDVISVGKAPDRIIR